MKFTGDQLDVPACVEHMGRIADVCGRDMTEYIAVKVYDASLPAGMGKTVVNALSQAPTGI